MEIWKDIVGFEGKFLVSSYGRIKTGPLHRLGPDKFRRIQVGSRGYCLINLCEQGRLVHRLVAGAFIPNPDGKETINHKDMDKTNNKVSNLEWSTRSENELHYYQVANPRIYNTKSIVQYDLYGNKIAEYDKILDAAKATGAYHANISACAKGRLKKTGGFVWRYNSLPD
jgi:hypothetical protein